jgi:hypothetical protein
MALRSVLDIDVNDSAFRDYKRAFEDYTKLVKGLPSDFAKSWAVIQKQRNAFNEMVASMVTRNYLEKQRVAAQKEADRLTKSQADHWREIAKASKVFADNIFGATLSFMKWAGPLSIVGGLLGAAGGLFGLDRLAAGVAAQRRGAMGLGINYGQGQAFKLDYGRFVDSGAMLGNVSGALYDATSPGYTGLLASGLQQSFLQSHNAAEVSRELLHRLPGLFAGTPRELVGAKAHALGIDQLISSQDIIRYLNASPAERAAQDKAYGHDVGTLGLSGKAQQDWQDFMTSLDRAGQGIEATFVRGLTPLTEPLSKLSESFSRAAEAFLGSDAVKDAIKGITAGLDRFANYVGTERFQTDIRQFVDGISYAAKKIVDVMSWLGLLPNRAGPAADNPITPETKKWDDGFPRYIPPSAGGGPNGTLIPGGSSSSSAPAGSTPGSAGAPSLAERERFIRSYAASVGIDPNVAMWAARHEGFGGKLGDNGTSGGDFQLHYDPRGRAVGNAYTAATGHDSRDPRFWQEQDRFALDWARRHGWHDWSSMRGQDPYVGIGQKPVVTIDNRTGSDPIITTSAAVNN